MPVSKQHLNATVSAGLTLCAPRRTERHTVSVNVCGEEGGGHYFVRVLCIGPPNMVWGARVPQSSMQEAHVVVSAPALFRWILTERTRKRVSQDNKGTKGLNREFNLGLHLHRSCHRTPVRRCCPRLPDHSAICACAPARTTNARRDASCLFLMFTCYL